jgi:hypothetical protein
MFKDLIPRLVACCRVAPWWTFRVAKGVEGTLELKVPVATKAPGAAMPMDGHKH